MYCTGDCNLLELNLKDKIMTPSITSMYKLLRRELITHECFGRKTLIPSQFRNEKV